MNKLLSQVSLAALLLGTAASQSALAQASYTGPTPYQSFADSPFSPLFNTSAFSYFYLDDFEAHAPTNTYIPTIGYTASAGVRIGPGPQTDSVDWDDPSNTTPATSPALPGGNNGSGTTGGSRLSNGAGSMTFTFNAGLLGGQLPTHVGIVWTDVGSVDVLNGPSGVAQGKSFVSFSATGAMGDVLMGAPLPALLGDGFVNGGTFEDRFFGVVNAAGISSITITTAASTDWEVDHLQYGALVAAPVPEPGQWLMMAMGAGCLAWGVRRRRAAVFGVAAPV